MTDITIPPEALEAHAKEILTHESWGLRSWSDLSDAEREERLEGSEAACLAMLENWPGMTDGSSWQTRPPCIILPLTENTDAE